MSNTMSCFFFLLSSIVVATSIITSSRCYALTLPSDVAALSALKSSVSPSSINSWSCLASWNFTSDPCRPLVPSHFVCGLTCSATTTTSSGHWDRITAITLDPAGYSGTLPSSSLFALSLLSHLHLSDNSFHGPIPPLSLPSLLTLLLSSNSFSGPIPPSLFAALPSIQTIDLSRNDLTGPIPTFSSSSALSSLDLSFNQLSGIIPSSLPPGLVQLSIRGNSISGSLDRRSFQSLKYLEVVELAANRIEGKIDSWFFLLPALQQVDLANNSITAIDAGNLQAAKGSKLVAIDLSYNRIGGQMPAGLAGFPFLAALSARHNRLTGTVPGEFGSRLRRLFLDGNFLNGQVPDALLKLDSGSLGDNCLDKCPSSMPICSPVQKPGWLCKQVYGVRRRRSHPSPAV